MTFKALDMTLITNHKGYFVYRWERPPEMLYIGCSENLLIRLLSHNIIGKIEEIKNTDIITIAKCDTYGEMIKLESDQILKYNPVYNKRKYSIPTDTRVRGAKKGWPVVAARIPVEMRDALKEKFPNEGDISQLIYTLLQKLADGKILIGKIQTFK